MVKGSGVLVGAFVVLPVVMLLLLAAGLSRSTRGNGSVQKHGVRAMVIAGVWFLLTAVAALAGRLSFETVPPTIMLAIVVGLVLVLRLGFSSLGERIATTIPLAWLIGSQAFRLPLELSMHRALAEGLMPVQMSYSGYNFDIVTGTTALILGVLLAFRRVPRGLVMAWNVMGLLLLLNVVVIAILSAPLPFRTFMNEPANTWITAFPYVWLPTILVPAALLGHVLVWRRLRVESGRVSASVTAAA